MWPPSSIYRPMWRGILQVAISFVIYLLSVWIVSSTADTLANLMAKIGSPELWVFLRQHFLGQSIAVGFLAGLIPLRLFLSVSGYFRPDVPEFFKKLDLEEMKRWIVVLVSPIAFLVLAQWMHDWSAMRSRTASVQDGLSMHFSEMVEAFFSGNCKDPSDIRIDLWVDSFSYQCMVHVLQVSVFLQAAAYSLAPWARQQFLKSVANDNPESMECALVDGETQELVHKDEPNQ